MEPDADIAHANKWESKYDIVKVKIRLGQGHTYVLSRFLISRMLTVIKVKGVKATKIALEVKKFLVDSGDLEVSQEHFEGVLFEVMRARGYGPEYERRYQRVRAFFQRRQPLIILLCGVPCTGKAGLAQALAQRLNLSHVLQTDLFPQVLREMPAPPLPPDPLWLRPGLDTEAGLIAAYERECRVLQQAVSADLAKCVGEGKSLVLEGLHLAPSLYLAHLRQLAGCPTGPLGRSSMGLQQPTPAGKQPPGSFFKGAAAAGGGGEAHAARAGGCCETRGPGQQGLDPHPHDGTEAMQEEAAPPPSSSGAPVVVPALLVMPSAPSGERDRLTHEWLVRSEGLDGRQPAALAALHAAQQRLQALEAHLLRTCGAQVAVVECSPEGAGDALGRLHDHVLQRIEAAVAESG